jgi:hypothetical protein
MKTTQETPRLLQDEVESWDVQRLSRWFASKPDARYVVRKFLGVPHETHTIPTHRENRVPSGSDRSGL